MPITWVYGDYLRYRDFAAIVEEVDHCELDSLLELIFFPDHVIRAEFESTGERPGFQCMMWPTVLSHLESNR